ncbi:MAG: hypothetical protein NVSMB1_12560 [Polyangiales bacterium]
MKTFSPAVLLAPLLMASVAAMACKKDEATSPGTSKVSSAPSSMSSASAGANGVMVVNGANGANGYDKLKRAEFNQRAQLANLPIYWTNDRNKAGTIEPSEVASLLFFPRQDVSVKDGAFTEAFETTYKQLAAMSDAPTAPTEGASKEETERRKLVREELTGTAPSLIYTDLRALAPEEKALARQLLLVASQIDDLYATQRGAKAMASRVPTDDAASQSAFRRNWGPGCETPKLKKDAKCSAIPGAPQAKVDVYPASLQSDEKFCQQIETNADAANLLGHFSAVREEGGKLKAVPYNEAYKEAMTAIAGGLRQASALVLDPKEEALRNYLGAAAQSFVSNDWVPADEAWAKMNAQNSKWYVRVAPDEVYWEPCSHKAGFHLAFARINTESLKWQEKLAPVQQTMEDAFAQIVGKDYQARKVTFHLPDFIDIIVNAGDDRHPIGATAGQSLPNWGPLVKQGRGRTMVMSNIGTDPDSLVARRTKAESLLDKQSMGAYDDAGSPGLLGVILHEATHNLGPAHEYKYKNKSGEQAFGGELNSMLEELKAQTGGVFYVDFLRKKGIIDEKAANRAYVDEVLWSFGHIARGMLTGSGKREPYGQLAAIQLGLFIDAGAVTFDPNALAANGADKGALTIHFDKMAAATESMMKVVGTIKATNDAPGAEALAKKYVEGPAVPHKIISERILRLPVQTLVYAVDM